MSKLSSFDFQKMLSKLKVTRVKTIYRLWSPALPMGMVLEGGEGGELEVRGVEGRSKGCFVFTSWLTRAFDLISSHKETSDDYKRPIYHGNDPSNQA